jgi:excisionase family DNA binding protein
MAKATSGQVSGRRGQAQAVRTADVKPMPGTALIAAGPSSRHGSAVRTYSVDEVARLAGLSRDLVYDEMRRGHLAYLKVGRRRLKTVGGASWLTPMPRPGRHGTWPSTSA